MTEENKSLDSMQKMRELLDLNSLEAIINSNEQVFEVEGITYKVKRPTYKQRQETYQQRIQKYTELLKDSRYLLEADLKKLYLSRGLDTDEILKTMKTKSERRDKLMFSLGESLTKNSPEQDLKTFKDEITILNEDIQALSMKHTMLYETSLEQQVVIYTISYMTFLVTEKKDGENWIRAWNTYEEFENAPEKVINLGSYYITLMTGNLQV